VVRIVGQQREVEGEEGAGVKDEKERPQHYILLIAQHPMKVHHIP
jgi:hypothetical protein